MYASTLILLAICNLSTFILTEFQHNKQMCVTSGIDVKTRSMHSCKNEMAACICRT